MLLIQNYIKFHFRLKFLFNWSRNKFTILILSITATKYKKSFSYKSIVDLNRLTISSVWSPPLWIHIKRRLAFQLLDYYYTSFSKMKAKHYTWLIATTIFFSTTGLRLFERNFNTKRRGTLFRPKETITILHIHPACINQLAQVDFMLLIFEANLLDSFSRNFERLRSD